MPKLVIAATTKIDLDLPFQELSTGYRNENNEKKSYNYDNTLGNPCTEISKASRQQVFPYQLMKILSIREYESIISWMPDGKSFFIHDKIKLNEVWTSFYFQNTKYDSFRRKLHRWGFRIAKKGSSAGAYYHQHFIRDNPSLCSKMTCGQKSGTKKSEKKKTVVKNVENQQINQQSHTLNTTHDAEKHENMFDNYVTNMHRNFWRKRPLLLEGSIYLQNHRKSNYSRSLIQSSNILGSINKLQLNPSKEVTSSLREIKIESKQESLARKNGVHAIYPLCGKSIKESMLIATARNMKINSTNAIAA